jgi:hypothetical protein
MDNDSLAALGADIQASGLVNPIVVHEGQIVDGRSISIAEAKERRRANTN